MKTVRHTNAARDRVLHVETEGCVVNIEVGLFDDQDRPVTSVRILPDDVRRGGDGRGQLWELLDESRVVMVGPNTAENREAQFDRIAVREANPTLDQELRALIARGLTFGDAMHVWAERNTDTAKAYITAAREHLEVEGSIEIDDAAITAGSEAAGDYVLAWVWVRDDQAGIDAAGEENDSEDEDGDEGGYTFDTDYGVHANGDEDSLISARNLEVGDRFQDPAYDSPGEWHTIANVWRIGDTVHIDAEGEGQDEAEGR